MKKIVFILIGIIAVCLVVQTYLLFQEHIEKQKEVEQKEASEILNKKHKISCIFAESDWKNKFHYSYNFLSKNENGKFSISDTGLFEFDLLDTTKTANTTINGNLRKNDQVLLMIWNDSKKGTVKVGVYEDGDTLEKFEGKGYPDPLIAKVTIK